MKTEKPRLYLLDTDGVSRIAFIMDFGIVRSNDFMQSRPAQHLDAHGLLPHSFLPDNHKHRYYAR